MNTNGVWLITSAVLFLLIFDLGRACERQTKPEVQEAKFMRSPPERVLTPEDAAWLYTGAPYQP